MQENNQKLTRGNKVFISIFILTMLLCVFKELIGINWWWCFAPIWGAIAFMIIIYIIIWVLDLMIGIEIAWQRKKRERNFKK